MKKLVMIMGLIMFSSIASAAYVYCPGTIDRVQIEGGQYVVFLTAEGSSFTVHNLGAVGDVQADKYFSVALTGYATRDKFQVRYTDPGSESCGQLRQNVSNISYVTLLRE